MSPTDIAEQLKTLLEVQELDREIYDFKRQLQEKPVLIESLQAAHQAEVDQGASLQEKSKSLKMKRDGLEGDLSSKEAQIKKLQLQLYSVKTNKEYTALQHEIEGLKADNSVLEEEILKVMDELDEQKKVLDGATDQLKGKEDQMRAKIKVIEEEMVELETKIGRLQDKRQIVVPKVDPQTLSRYEHILGKREGIALVPVLPREGVCGGCRMNIPPQVINEVHLGGRLIACESCARLLYYPEDEAR